MSTLSEYLRTRSLDLDPVNIEILAIDPEVMEQISKIPEDSLNALVQIRVNSIGREMLHNATPEEVIVLREALVEVGGIMSDYIGIREHLKRIKPSNPEEPQVSPPIEEGAEGSI